MNHYFTSTGERLTHRQITDRLIAMYFIANQQRESLLCDGCMKERATNHAHIIPRARCKQLRKAELIWDRKNIFFSCIKCNAIAENVSGQAIKKLKNFEYIKAYLKEHDQERFKKLI